MSTKIETKFTTDAEEELTAAFEKTAKEYATAVMAVRGVKVGQAWVIPTFENSTYSLWYVCGISFRNGRPVALLKHLLDDGSVTGLEEWAADVKDISKSFMVDDVMVEGKSWARVLQNKAS